MWRIMGNCPERLRIADMGDVVYYHQIKDYTDQEYESSRDLQKFIQKGAVTVLEHANTPQSVGTPHGTVVNNNVSNAIDIDTLKQAMREVFPEMGKSVGATDLRTTVMEILPHLMDTIRQEMSRLSPVSGTSVKVSSTYMDPTYTPDIDTSGMVGNIKAEEKSVSGSDMVSALLALQQMKSQ